MQRALVLAVAVAAAGAAPGAVEQQQEFEASAPTAAAAALHGTSSSAAPPPEPPVPQAVRPCSAQRPPFCTTATRGRHVVQSNWSCAERAATPNPCDVCHGSQCGGCSQCTGPLPSPPPDIAWRPQPSKPPPADWTSRVAAGQMFFSGEELRAGYSPSLGNGFISGDAGCCTRRCTDCTDGVCRSCHSSCTSAEKEGGQANGAAGSVELSGCGRLHIAGVFNGALGNPVGPGEPNRARVSNPHSVFVADELEWIGGALDLERGMFLNRSVVTCPEDGTNATITVISYHHRRHKSLAVLSIEGPGRPCTVRLGSCALSSEATDFNATTVGGGGRRLEVLAMEQPNEPAHATAAEVQQQAPPPKKQPACSTLQKPFCHSGGWPKDKQIYSCTSCGSCVGCPNCTLCSGLVPITPPCEWPKPPAKCACLALTSVTCNNNTDCTWHPDIGACKPKNWFPPSVVGVAATPVPVNISFSSTKPSATFLAVYRSSLEDGITQASAASTAVTDLAKYTAQQPNSLLASHIAMWAELWESGVEVKGNATIAATVNVTFYAILSSLRDDTPLGCSPSGLSRNNYEGHSFWDCETWIFPSLVLQWPAIAQSMTQYRFDRLYPAQQRAKVRGLQGAMWPWESALTGYDMCAAGQTEGTHEIHISGDIPRSFRLHYLTTRNDSWLRSHAWPVVKASADFFASRAKLDAASGNYTQKAVVTPDEGAGIVSDAAYTNALAARTMEFASEIATKLGLKANPAWAVQAARPYLPLVTALDPGGPIHAEFTGYKGEPIAQSAVALLQYPLRWPMPVDVARRDLAFYQSRTSGPTTAGFFTGDSSYSIAWLQAGNHSEAEKWFAEGFVHLDLQGFGVWMEMFYSHHDGGALNEISSGGAFLQNVIYGYAGVDLRDEGIVFDSQLPPMGVTELTLRGVAFAGRRLRYQYNASSLTFRVTAGGDDAGTLGVTDVAGKVHVLGAGVALELPLQRVVLHASAARE